MESKAYAPLVVALVLVGSGVLSFLHWTVGRIYVPTGYSLQLRYKGPLIFGSHATAERDHWADEEKGEIGIFRELRGPGRHFYWPIWWERVVVPDVVIEPGEVGIVTCKLGDALPNGQFIVDGELGKTEFKGVLRKPLTPGRYRINPYGYDVKIIRTEQSPDHEQPKFSGWVNVPTGFVGVVTNLADNPATEQKIGIQDKVLPPGLYPLNPREQQVDIVEVGYRECTVIVENRKTADGKFDLDEAGEPQPANTRTGITFPSSDGFDIAMDYTAIWGIMPNQAPHTVRTFGNVMQVENKVILPQIESICRNIGSRYAATNLLTGDERELYQNATLLEFQKVLQEKQISLLYGLVRHIYIPKQVRQPIQSAFIADELALTRQQEQETARSEAALREAEQRVTLEKQRVVVDTDRQYQTKVAEGEREAKRIDAETEKLAAAIQKETAQLQADAKTELGKAENQGKQLNEEAKADRFRLAVEAFGSPAAYNNWVFANGLPDDLELKFLYAGEGTLWTDLKNLGLQATLPVKKPSEPKPETTPAATSEPVTAEAR